MLDVLDKPKYGGPGKKKQCCIKRKCLQVVPAVPATNVKVVTAVTATGAEVLNAAMATDEVVTAAPATDVEVATTTDVEVQRATTTTDVRVTITNLQHATKLGMLYMRSVCTLYLV